ncbi:MULTISPECIES: SPOR domain-containing protein [Pseudomonas]|jgi:cell division septation protein DedD|uniref:SPOR domain-containing protein n=1 Tax=Pseudomonas rhodesiae TaxID=76760 RepID=A0A8I1E857_9PSED|nr:MULTISPECIES: sporulation protein [Pseudomonas]OXS19642.1 penicillin-binding protein activator LpoB [Pseudomonas fluorescens]KAF6687018.1 SPOR domain-containing protein [Pseudomonas sp. EKM23D]MBI6605294.1 SPOR domain-containing protein [Pseudomonas sp. S4_EA_1b]MBI6626802.1 SPOR domain-containing protein [Pseudomonas rhodesiae]MBX4139357.1 SPOR domain-containing protein [Pseudomonas sp. S5F11]
MAMMVLALAGCGEGKPVDTPKAKPAVSESQPQTGAIAVQEWDVRVGPPDHKLQAITDLTAWLLEHGFNFYIVKVDGKDEVLLGPFATKEEAEAKQALLTEKLARAKKNDTESQVIEHKAAQ